MSFTKGFMLGGMLDSSLTLYLNSRYGLDSGGAGLVFIAAVARELHWFSLTECRLS